MLKGIGASDGYGIGKAVVIDEKKPEYISSKAEDAEKEIRRFEKAVEIFRNTTQKKADVIRREAGAYHAKILEGHMMMLADPFMQDEIRGMIKTGVCAEEAVDSACDMFVSMFSRVDDELTRQRAADVDDIRLRLLRILTGVSDAGLDRITENTVLVMKNLTPSLITGIVKGKVAGIVTECGGKYSHAAILARALEIPVVSGVRDICSVVSDGIMLAVDGFRGECIAEPSDAEIAFYTEKRKVCCEGKEQLNSFRSKETFTLDGMKVKLSGNAGIPQDIYEVRKYGGEGIGLYRTEFLFMNTDGIPSEEEQFEIYKNAAELMDGREVMIRTFDISAEKNISCSRLIKEKNPELGFRAVRYLLEHEEIYRIQLRALLRASAYGNIKIIVPFVTCPDEIRRVKAIIEELKCELDASGVRYDKNIRTGVMIETPAAGIAADLLARESDFFSIGTNDLIQYIMAADRDNAAVAYLYSPYHPAVLRMIKHIVDVGRKNGLDVGLCGEAAADTLLIPVFISFGIKEFSVNASAILNVRQEIGRWTKVQAENLCRQIFSCETEREVYDLLKKNARDNI